MFRWGADGGESAGECLLTSWMPIDGCELGDCDEHPFVVSAEQSRKVSLFSTIISSLRVLILNLILFKIFWDETNLFEGGLIEWLSDTAILESELLEAVLLTLVLGVLHVGLSSDSKLFSLEKVLFANGSEEQTPSLLTFMITETGTAVTFGITGLGVRGGVLDMRVCKNKK